MDISGMCQKCIEMISYVGVNSILYKFIMWLYIYIYMYIYISVCVCVFNDITYLSEFDWYV